MAGSCLKDGQDICDVRPDGRVPIPTLLDQHPDIFRKPKDLPVRWPRWSLASEYQYRYGKGVNARERIFVCESLQIDFFRLIHQRSRRDPTS